MYVFDNTVVRGFPNARRSQRVYDLTDLIVGLKIVDVVVGIYYEALLNNNR